MNGPSGPSPGSVPVASLERLLAELGRLREPERSQWRDPVGLTGSLGPRQVLRRLLAPVAAWVTRPEAEARRELVAVTEVLVRREAERARSEDDLERVLARRLPASGPWLAGQAEAIARALGQGVAGPGRRGGRVLVADAAGVEGVAAVRAVGVDAYGIDLLGGEPLVSGVDRAGRPAGGATGYPPSPFEVRVEGLEYHLATVSDRVLGGVVLVGVPQRWPAGRLVRLAPEVARVLRPTGRLVVGWPRVAPELAGGMGRLLAGRGLPQEVWDDVLGAVGFDHRVDLEPPPGEAAGQSGEFFVYSLREEGGGSGPGTVDGLRPDAGGRGETRTPE